MTKFNLDGKHSLIPQHFDVSVVIDKIVLFH